MNVSKASYLIIFSEDQVTQKIRVMMLNIQLWHDRNKLHLKDIKIVNGCILKESFSYSY